MKRACGRVQRESAAIGPATAQDVVAARSQ